MTIIPNLIQLVRRAVFPTNAQLVVWGAWCALLVATEIVGRASTSDTFDVLLGMCLLTVTAMLHAVCKLPPVNGLLHVVDNLLDRIRRLAVESGIDLRQSPPVPAAYPGSWEWLAKATLLTTVVAFAASPFLPWGLRYGLGRFSYVAYLCVMTSIWSAIATLIVFGVYFAWTWLHDLLLVSTIERPRTRKHVETVLVAGSVIGMILGLVLLPPAVPLLISAVAIAIASGSLLLTGSDVKLLWKDERVGALRGMDSRVCAAMIALPMITAAVALVLISHGSSLMSGAIAGVGRSPMMLTEVSGRILSWAMVPVLVLMAVQSLSLLRHRRRFDAERLMVQHPRPEDPFANPDYRRWEITQRRHLVRGLRRLFKAGAARKGKQGTGYMLAPQHWYITGLSRDTADKDDETTIIERTIGTPYHRAFPPETRFHFWQITTALHVDLIFVEDGVSFRRFVRVLRIMFETYDMHAGERRAEERDFVGLPGVRVIIHEFGMSESESHGQESYPEPDYETIGRARILHIFKDREESEELDEVPESWDDVPLLSGMW